MTRVNEFVFAALVGLSPMWFFVLVFGACAYGLGG